MQRLYGVDYILPGALFTSHIDGKGSNELRVMGFDPRVMLPLYRGGVLDTMQNIEIQANLTQGLDWRKLGGLEMWDKMMVGEVRTRLGMLQVR